ncbi:MULTISPECIES: 4Fe-4S binding protein [unclassified Fusibacter]|uniref:4Fe-4S binding protein n=1 Tax=unclassified Fusibacter TaxID=2624464 RepID=UPI0013E91A8C|nr:MULTISPECIES: FMN-binding protein [unclassified Fusibacter]MCK8059148.1 4Fe-4S binding protein [Fusibacter sp. A2]NPE22557.1 4Fe-4S binding protein [Fusibacter sp. A1]
MRNTGKIRLAVQLLSVVLAIWGLLENIQVTVALVFVTTVLAGPFFCGWICPMGTLQDLMGRLNKRKKLKMPRYVHKYLIFTRYLLWGLMFGLGFDLMHTLLKMDARADLNGILSGKQMSLSVYVIIATYAAISYFFERPFCNYFCLQGAQYGLIGILRPFRITRNKLLCVDCKQCDKVCPMNNELSKVDFSKSLHCINCLRCVESCPKKGALAFKSPPISANQLILYLVAVALCISVYVGMFSNHAMKEERVTKEVVLPSVVESSSEESFIGDPSENNEYSSGLKDGFYTGEAIGFRGLVVVGVTIENGSITGVEVVSHREDRRWYMRAIGVIPNAIIQAQSADVDSVTGATYSSNAIINGAKEALEKAMKAD